MRSLNQRDQVTKLRKLGYSYSFISERTGVSKSTLSDWLSGLAYTPNKEVLVRIGKARAASGARHAVIKKDSLDQATREAIQEIGKLSQRDLSMFGLGLYLGEGSKTNNVIRIVNSDPAVVFLASAWFKSYGITQSQFAPRIHLYPDTNIPRAIKFWARILAIPTSQFLKSHVDVRTNKKTNKKGKLPHGTLHLSIRSGGKREYGVFFFRKIQAMNAEVLRIIQKAGVV